MTYRESRETLLASRLGEQSGQLLEPLAVTQWQRTADAGLLIINARFPEFMGDGRAAVILVVVRASPGRTDLKNLPQLRQTLLQYARDLTTNDAVALIAFGGEALSSRFRAQCRETHMGYVDLEGPLLLVGPGVYIERSFMAAPQRHPGPRVEVTDGPKPASFSDLVAKPSGYCSLVALLEARRSEWTTRSLGKAAGISSGMAQHVKEEMAQLGLVQELSRGFRFVRPGRAIDLWAAHYLGKDARGRGLIADPRDVGNVEVIDRRLLRGGLGSLWNVGKGQTQSAEIALSTEMPFDDANGARDARFGDARLKALLHVATALVMGADGPKGEDGSSEDGAGEILGQEHSREESGGQDAEFATDTSRRLRDAEFRMLPSSALSGPTMAYIRLLQTVGDGAIIADTPFIPHIILHTRADTKRLQAGLRSQAGAGLGAGLLWLGGQVQPLLAVLIRGAEEQKSNLSVVTSGKWGSLTVLTAKDRAGFRIGTKPLEGREKVDLGLAGEEAVCASDTQIYVDLLRLASAISGHDDAEDSHTVFRLSLFQLIRNFRHHVLRQ